MLLKIYSYNGTQLNDDTNFQAWFPEGSPVMPAVALEWAKRNQAFPQLAGKNLAGGTLTIGIECKGTIHSQFETLKKLFAEDDFTLHKLIAKDSADSNRQWYVNGYAAGPLTPDPEAKGTFYVLLAVEEPFWRVNTPSPLGTWDVTATGQTKTATVLGNKQARPLIKITPATPRYLGYLYKRPVIVYNNTDLPLPHFKLDVTNGGIDSAALIADASVSNQLNGGINDTVTTINIDTPVGGGLATAGMGYIGTEQIAWLNNTGTQLTGVTRGFNGTTPASHADHAVIKRSKMQADGSDWRCLVDSVERNRWLSGMNTAASQMWIDITFKPRVELTLKMAISNTGTPATIDFAITAANQTAFARLPAKGYLLLGSELFSYSALDHKTLKATVTARALNSTTAATHAIGITVRWIEHILWMLYGDYDRTSPAANNTYKPIFDLNSTMASQIYSTFYDADSLRGGWQPAVMYLLGTGGGSEAVQTGGIYTGSHRGYTDPATEMGIFLESFQMGRTWKANSIDAEWRLYSPLGFTTITVTGAKFRTLIAWPVKMACEVSNDGTHWTEIFNEATPSSAGSWVALASHSGVSLGGTFKYVRFHMKGSTGSGSDAVSWEAQAVTLVRDSSNVPSVTVGAELAADVHYHLQSKITNNRNDEYIQIEGPIKIDQTLTIDCDEMTAELDDGVEVYGYLTISQKTSEEWLPLEAGTTNQLQYDEAGVTGETVVITWEDRNTL